MEQINQFLSFTAQAQRAVFEEPLSVPHNRNNYNVDSTTQTSLDIHSIALSMKILFYRWENTDHLGIKPTVSTVFSSLGCPEYQWMVGHIQGWISRDTQLFLLCPFFGISQKSKTHVSFCSLLQNIITIIAVCTSFYFPCLTNIVEGIIQKKIMYSMAWI